MTMDYEAAAAQVTAPGERFEVQPIDVGGITYKAFVNTLPSLRDLFAMAHGRGDTTFLVYEDERWSFADVGTQVAALGHALVERYGVQKGDRVAIAMRNYPEWVMSFAAITSVGAISVSLNSWWTEDELDFALGRLAPRRSSSPTTSASTAPRRRASGWASGSSACAPTVTCRTSTDWADVVVAGNPLPDVEVGPDDDATILYTSGTTGHPKGAVSTHRAVLQALLGFALPGHDPARHERRPEEAARRPGRGRSSSSCRSST